MPDIKSLAKEFILSHFKEKESFFDETWDFIISNYGKAQTTKKEFDKLGGALNITGQATNSPVIAMVIFADAAKTISSDSDNKELLEVILQAGKKINAQEKLLNKMAEFIEKHTTNDAESVQELLFEVWDRTKGTYKASQKQVTLLKKDKTIVLLLDEEERIYVFAKDVMDFLKQKYAILEILRFLLRNRGSAYLIDIFDKLKDREASIEEDEIASAKRSIRHVNKTLKMLKVNKPIFQFEKRRVIVEADMKICSIQYIEKEVCE